MSITSEILLYLAVSLYFTFVSHKGFRHIRKIASTASNLSLARVTSAKGSLTYEMNEGSAVIGH